MSRIAGFSHREDRVADEQRLAEMLAVMSHRGCDRQLQMCGGVAAIGVNLLHTTAESRFESIYNERFPRHWIVADARLDNRDDLIRQLDLQNWDADSTSDGLLILAAYHRWSSDSPKYLLGDFAFAIYDSENRLWFCARDQMGTKPFYYHLSGQIFAFASESKVMLVLPGVSPEFNEERIGDFLVSAWDYDYESTYFRYIRRLPPAHSIRVTEKGALVSRYWDLADAPEQNARSDAEYNEQFRELFTESVLCRLRSDTPVSTMMSGGVDSSSITCVAHALAREEGLPAIQTFSGISDPDWKCRELPYVQALINYLQIQPRLIPAEEMAKYRDDIPELLSSFDEPHGSGMLDQRMLAWRFAAESGSKVMLDGLGGDDIFSFPEPAVAMLAESGRLTKGLGLSLMMWQSWGGFNREGFGSAWNSFSPPARRWLVPHWARMIKRWFSPPPVAALGFRKHLISDEFRFQSGVSGRVQADYDARQIVPKTVRDLAIRFATGPDMAGAQEMYDNVAAQFGIEPRRPCLDRRLVEFCIGLPVNQKVRRGWNKWILRSSMSGVVPNEVRWRRNIGGVLWRSKYLALLSAPAWLKSQTGGIPELVGVFINHEYWNSTVSAWYEKRKNEDINDIIDVLALESFMRSAIVLSKFVAENQAND